MKKIFQTNLQLKGFLILSAFIFVFTLILFLIDRQVFVYFFGKINPIWGILFLILLGTFLINILNARGYFQFTTKRSIIDILKTALPTILLAAVIIFVDIKHSFSEDTNVLFPKSILYYPIMAFVVEILFHLLPLVSFTTILNPVFKNISPDRILWITIVLVALLEPVFQTVLGYNPQDPLWFTVYVGIHIFIINLLQLSVFKRFDFLSMYSFRIIYYMLWHVLWGYLRLKILF